MDVNTPRNRLGRGEARGKLGDEIIIHRSGQIKIGGAFLPLFAFIKGTRDQAS